MIPSIKRFFQKYSSIYRVAFVTWQLINDLYDIFFIETRWMINKFRSYLEYLLHGTPIITKQQHRLFKLISRLCVDHQVTTVIDVGANDGWFYKLMQYYVRPPLRYIGFEPILDELTKVQPLLKRGDVLFNYCIGANSGTVQFHEYGTSGVSSILPLSNTATYNTKLYDLSDSSKKNYEVKVHALDEIINCDMGDNFFLKIDVQGFELQVLKGATQLLYSGQVRLVLLEVMVIPKYEGQTSWFSLIEFMCNAGYTIKDIYLASQTYDGLSEMDILFEKIESSF